MILTIEGRKPVKEIKSFLFELLSLLFLYLGSYPRMESLVINNKKQDLSNLIVKFNTREEFIKPEMVICNIENSSINETVLNKFRNINKHPIYSLEYLVSKEYKHVVMNHKLTLLLHVMEGLADRSVLRQLEDELRNLMGTKNLIGKFKASSYNILKNNFFKYHKKFDCGIFTLLDVDEMSFLEKITDTRNWHSHFYDESKKKNRLKKGDDMLYYFYIIFFAIRIYLIDSLGVSLNEEKIKEYCFMLHDWVLTEKHKKNEPLKSKTYNNVESRKTIEQIILKYNL